MCQPELEQYQAEEHPEAQTTIHVESVAKTPDHRAAAWSAGERRAGNADPRADVMVPFQTIILGGSLPVSIAAPRQ